MTDPALDPVAIAAARPYLTGRVERVRRAIEAHLNAHDGYVAWSGGSDSTAVVALAHSVRPDVPVVLFDSGVEYPETTQYIEDVTALLDLNTHIIPATPDALTILRASTAWQHGAEAAVPDLPDLHEALITEPARQAHERFGRGELSGLRARESATRLALMGATRGTYVRAGADYVLAPLWNWTTVDVRAYLHSREIPLNPVYARLADLGAPEKSQRVGMMIDGNGLGVGRAHWLRRGWPAEWARLVEALPRLAEFG